MPLSISSSEQRSLTNELVVARERSFFPRAVMLLGLMGLPSTKSSSRLYSANLATS